MSYQKSSKKEYQPPPRAAGSAGKHFAPKGKSKPKDYGNQLADKLDSSE